LDGGRETVRGGQTEQASRVPISGHHKHTCLQQGTAKTLAKPPTVQHMPTMAACVTTWSVRAQGTNQLQMTHAS
jgi:hypothetical protein